MGPSETSNQLDVVRTPAGKDPIPPFLRVEEQLPTDELDWQIGQLESEVHRYVGVEPKDFSKAAVRMYKLFRLKGFHEEATHLRDLFDEPATILYRVPSLLHTLQSGPDTEKATIPAKVDELILTVIQTSGGDKEAAIVAPLLQLRDCINEEGTLQSDAVGSARDKVIRLVNDFFYDRLTSVPSLRDYIVKLELGM